MTIAADYIDGKVNRAEALGMLRRYQLVSRERAEQSLSFIEHYRSYVINYGLGQGMVARDLARSGGSAETRWRRMEASIRRPLLPADLKR